MRQTQGSMLCPSCGKLISVSEEKCPFCGAWNPSLYGFGPGLQRWVGRRLDLVSVIVTACVVLYVAALALQPEAILHFTGFFGILSPGSRALYQLGMTGGVAWEERWWWTLLTAIYLHGSLLHIFFNLMWVRQLGPAVVEFFGPARAFVIFNVAGAVGFLVSDLASGGPSIGASGAIFGLLAALIVYGRRVNHSMLTTQVWQWALIMFVMGFLMPSVNNWAHAGGFAGGWLVAQVMPIEAQRREGRLVMIIGLLLALATAAGVVLSFVEVTGVLLRSRG
jgi:rhomboid protease GluP